MVELDSTQKLPFPDHIPSTRWITIHGHIHQIKRGLQCQEGGSNVQINSRIMASLMATLNMTKRLKSISFCSKSL